MNTNAQGEIEPANNSVAGSSTQNSSASRQRYRKDLELSESTHRTINTANLQPQIPGIGNVDNSFTTNLSEGPSKVFSLATQSDGKILVGGEYNQIGDIRRGSLERFNADGSRDASFNPGGVGANGAVYVVIVLPNGKIMIGGSFSTFNNLNSPRIARLNSDGSLDQTFTVQGTSTNSAIQDMVIQPDGKILISGNFISFNAIVRNRVARLNADGTLDTGFNPNANGFVEELVLQPDGKIFIGGVFTQVGGISRSCVARLNADGSVDSSFNVGSGVLFRGFQGAVYAAEIQPDGKILIGGQFDQYNGITVANTARLNSDGSLDTSFIGSTDGESVEFFALQPDGKIVAVGIFYSFTGAVRLNSNGSFDSTFTIRDVDDFGYVVTLQNDGKIIVGGLFSKYGENSRRNLVRLEANGIPDNFTVDFKADPLVRAIVQQPDGKVIVGGQFRRAGGVARFNVARFNLNGTLDQSFDPGLVSDGLNSPSVWSIGLQPDGKILVGGLFGGFNRYSFTNIARLNQNGSSDSSFFYRDAITVVRDIKVRPDGKIYLAGFFNDEFGSIFSGFVRLNPNGTYDLGAMDSGANNTAVKIKLLPDGKAMIMGSFTTYNGISRNRIARLNSDLSLDTSFNPFSGADGTVYDVALLPNGFMYVGGFFTSYNGLSGTNDIVRISSDGAVDPSFGSSTNGFNGGIYSLALEPDNKILVGGNFNAYNGVPVNRMALLNLNGSLDSSFTSPVDNNSVNYVYSLYRQTDGKLLIGGLFNSPKTALFRLNSAVTTNRVKFDYDGDGKADVSVFRPANGNWYLNRSMNGFAAVAFGQSGDKLVPADFDGDGKTDTAVFRDGNWYSLRSSDGGFSSVFFGQSGDIPVAGDFDGDDRADQAVFRNGTWYLNRSTLGYTFVQFGISSDKPVAADFDGDGKTDIAVYRDGNWYYLKSSDGGFVAVSFGVASDIPVVADYDGDGRDDQAVYRNGIWYLNQSTAGFAAVSFGLTTDKPVPADFDGDGKADVAVYRDGNWYIQQSTNGFTAQFFGQTGDLPTPNAFVP